MTDYKSFRQQLDAVLRTRDTQQVSTFLVGSGQWDEGSPADPELAMWLMIAGSPTLRDMHTQAGAWLVEHGHADEAAAVLERSKSSATPAEGKKKRTQPYRARGFEPSDSKGHTQSRNPNKGGRPARPTRNNHVGQ